ncbi:GAF and ANTAR domain-containing protein [Actinophytocola algeriensis]|uniref:ANTAR domain-containing protein n=1 Tax=Actinophytocola algeriensis TaxID=1768010 RepID=A0A7W7VJR7_9PSEU|nr:GAF and ANTAR domain-containing protein [Actinophytocola algeriensis]MBB4912763.1 hypothetical protein [Actinophytocola algeriensis]MBE1473569.1 hypothetical protein [Actinophytocola algeriensis]
MDRIQETSVALAELTDSIRPDEPREVLLARVASRVVRLMPGADAVTVTLVVDGTPNTVAATEESLVPLDQIQYTTGTGPCLDALRTETLVRAERADMAQRWPAFADVAETTGVLTSLSCPLFLPADGAASSRRALDHRLSGALNVWSFQPDAFAPAEATLIAMFTSALSSIILTATRWAAAEKQTDQLLVALETRDAIATAKGIVMVYHRLGVDEAFQWLVDASQRTNRKIRDLARLIIDDPDVVNGKV